jgi:Tol biopolymer transport system component
MRSRIHVLLTTALTVSLLTAIAIVPPFVKSDDSGHTDAAKVKPVFTVHHVPKVPGIIFQAETVDAINLYVCGPDGVPRPLTDRSFAKRPSASHDGRILFFQDSEDNPLDAKEMTEDDKQIMAMNPLFLFQVYALDMATGKRTHISDGSALDTIPVASPASVKKVAFCSRLPERGSSWEILLMNHDGSDREPLDDVRDGAQLYPSWSPDAKKIVYVLAKLVHNETNQGPEPKTDLMIRDLEKRSTKVLPTKDMILDDPSWSPKGNRIAFTVYDIKSESYSLWQINVDGSEMQPITDGPDDQEPSWFPDGRSLFFTRGAENDPKEICMLDLKTRKITRLISATNASCERPHFFPARAPAWEPKKQ